MKYYIAILTLFFPVVLLADEKKADCTFIIHDLKTKNCPQKIGTQFASIIKKRISEEKSFIMKDPISALPGNFRYAECFKTECAAKLKKYYPDGIIIIGEISKKEYEEVDQKISKYAVKVGERERYLVNIIAVNQKDNKTDLRFKKEFFNDDRIPIEANRIGKQVRDFYAKRISLSPVIKPAEIKSQEKKSPEIKKEDKTREPFYKIYGITLSPSFLYPAGSYSKLFKYGYGIDAGLNGIIVPVKEISITPGMGVYNLKNNSDNIKSGQMAALYIKAGYSFKLSGTFTTAPYIAAGYIFHFIKGDMNTNNTTSQQSNESNFYYNPGASAGIILGYSVSEKYDIIGDASYRFFADKNNIYSLLCVNLGIKLGW